LRNFSFVAESVAENVVENVVHNAVYILKIATKPNLIQNFVLSAVILLSVRRLDISIVAAPFKPCAI